MSFLWRFLVFVALALAIAAIVIAGGAAGSSSSSSSSSCCKKRCSSSSSACRSSARSASVLATGTIALTVASTDDEASSTGSGYLPILQTSVITDKCTNQLICTVSAYSAIGTLDIHESGAEISLNVAEINLQVLVDGVAINPDPLRFDAMVYLLATNLSEDAILIELQERALAHSFTFMAPNIAPGLHTIQVQADLEALAASDPALITATRALLGDRTLVVQPALV